MKSRQFEKTQVNIEALDTELRQQFGDTFVGLSTDSQNIILHFEDDVTDNGIQAARSMLAAHDPTVLTSSQAKQASRQQAIDLARSQFTEDLDVSSFDSQPNLIRLLAERIAWLEQEVRDLRGL